MHDAFIDLKMIEVLFSYVVRPIYHISSYFAVLDTRTGFLIFYT